MNEKYIACFCRNTDLAIIERYGLLFREINAKAIGMIRLTCICGLITWTPSRQSFK